MATCPLCELPILGSAPAHIGWCRVERTIERVMDATLKIEREEDR